MATHRLDASPETVHWGYFDAAVKPALTVASGDTVDVSCVSGRRDVLPPPGSGLAIPPALAAINDRLAPELGAHILTGPIAIEGAEPGDMLEVRIEKVTPGADWGYNMVRPLAGTLPEDFPLTRVLHIPVDRARNTCRLPWGTELALSPFFGVMGVAPPPAYGRIASNPPREHAGNLDNKELVAGTTLFLPVWVNGANFSVGDGHGVQGDGEVCITALEMCLDGTFTFVLHKKTGPAPVLAFPRAETKTHFISMGLNEDLDLAMKQALREMIAFIASRTNLSPLDAYQFCSLAADFRVTQTVNGVKGVHGMLRKDLI
ncbi:MAG: acetamidase/formamidase family protein [Acetobacteraceae bacterium]|jgi:acetamidase/formamidase|nr:acetamidase/formamidase family protein [Acetobacteraceae bacterium]